MDDDFMRTSLLLELDGSKSFFKFAHDKNVHVSELVSHAPHALSWRHNRLTTRQ
jgi:hypothetical protein